MWQQYLQEYAKTRPECLREWKSSPLANDHDFFEFIHEPSVWRRTEHLSQIIDLRTHQWSDVRKSYRNVINRAMRNCIIAECEPEMFVSYEDLHIKANHGPPRRSETYAKQKEWLNNNHAIMVAAFDGVLCIAAAYWIIYKQCAYYASGPSIRENVQHAIIWRSLQLLKEQGVYTVELGQIDGETEKEKGIGLFKAGFGGEAMPFTIVRKMVA